MSAGPKVSAVTGVKIASSSFHAGVGGEAGDDRGAASICAHGSRLITHSARQTPLHDRYSNRHLAVKDDPATSSRITAIFIHRLHSLA
ncbi:hypothetical protein CDAR_407501 [Caerostris darwini]|uniref:Uncharacterized protein n=1 Tax=Caerostris darwini TaxID=1538125 RepID=A0AAV4Q1R6_9ARAC|nr:hypothetical protein CDAR_407501 [Caerostris darwini]